MQAMAAIEDARRMCLDGVMAFASFDSFDVDVSLICH
jgi:hypothetical protein